MRVFNRNYVILDVTIPLVIYVIFSDNRYLILISIKLINDVPIKV